MLFNNISPSIGSYNLCNKVTKVDLPPPLYPTNAIVLPFSILRERFLYTNELGLDGYANLTFFNSKSYLKFFSS